MGDDPGDPDGGGFAPVGVQKGRFFVSNEYVSNRSIDSDDDASDAGNGDARGGTTVRQKGRFLVMTEPDEDDDEDFTSDEASLSDKQRISLNSLNSFQESSQTSSQLKPAFLSNSDSVPTPALTSQQLPPLAPNQGGQSVAGTVSVASEAAAESNNSNAPLQRRSTDGNPRKPVGNHSNNILAELQKISAQNHKLHRMLLNLTNNADSVKRAVAGGQGPSGDADSASSGAPAALGSSESAQMSRRPSSDSLGGDPSRSRTASDRTASGGSANENASKRITSGGGGSGSVPKYDNTVRLQELAQELNLNTASIAQEYDALKAKNFVLTKQLKETKKQLTEANLVIENLRQQLGKMQQQQQ